MRFDDVTDRRATAEWQCGCTMIDCHPDFCSTKAPVSELGEHESDSDTVSTGDGEDMAANSNYSNLNQESSDAVATFGNISVVNSSDVHFGNKTFYSGPVTIKQFVYSNSDDVDSTLATDSSSDKRNVAQLLRKLTTSPDSLEPLPSDFGVSSTRPVDLKTDNALEKVTSHSFPSEDASSKPNRNQERFLKTLLPFCSSHLNYILLIVATLVVTLLVITVTILVVKRDNNENSATMLNPPVPERKPFTETNFTLPGKLLLKDRISWLAQPIECELEKLNTPVPYVIISHTASDQCTKISECVLLVRTIQTFHVESKKWCDIGYNFLVGGDGYAYIGRNWGFVGAHTYGYNRKSIGISFIGTFTNVLPPKHQIEAAQQLIELGLELGKISPDYKLLAPRQLQATESPGLTLFEEMKKWPHWSATP